MCRWQECSDPSTRKECHRHDLFLNTKHIKWSQGGLEIRQILCPNQANFPGKIIWWVTWGWRLVFFCLMHGKSRSFRGFLLVNPQHDCRLTRWEVHHSIPTRWCPPSYKMVYNPNKYRYFTPIHQPEWNSTYLHQLNAKFRTGAPLHIQETVSCMLASGLLDPPRHGSCPAFRRILDPCEAISKQSSTHRCRPKSTQLTAKPSEILS